MSKPQLFCFTYAGGSSSFFDTMEKDLLDVELIKPEYSGHGTRHKEPLYKDFDELADDVYDIIKASYIGGDYALFGYSMGTITLVEILKRIFAVPDFRNPSHIFLAAHEPQTKTGMSGLSEDKIDEWVKERTIRFGTVPEKLINNNSFWRMYLPLYRADYSIIWKYRFEDLMLQTDIPTTVFYSESDTLRSDMELWRKYFTGEFDFYQFDGTHFFIQEHHREMANIIKGKMEKHYDV